ncbi:MAG: hypothetical protein IPJ82_02800 [Lewinellaceae bacterium]|nr:hypothetical protein [Lewinellaceae bacterium]
MKNDPPEYLVRKNDGGQLGDLLKIGVGLEYLTHDWVFGLWADYSKNIAKSDAGFDALTLQAGLLYRFN